MSMQELASRYVKGEITMAKYVTGINEMLRNNKHNLESTMSKLKGNYQNKEQGK